MLMLVVSLVRIAPVLATRETFAGCDVYYLPVSA